MAYYGDIHLQDRMQLEDFDSSTAFRVHKDYFQHCVPYRNLPSCSAIDGPSAITRLFNNDYDHYQKNSFTFELHEADLFYYLVKRDVFIQVDSELSSATYIGDGDDNGRYDPVQYSIPKSEERIFRRKENFIIGHIGTKLQKLQLPTIYKFTLRKRESILINGLHYQVIVNGEHIMSVNKNQADTFFQEINKQFITTDGTNYHRKYDGGQ